MFIMMFWFQTLFLNCRYCILFLIFAYSIHLHRRVLRQCTIRSISVTNSAERGFDCAIDSEAERLRPRKIGWTFDYTRNCFVHSRKRLSVKCPRSQSGSMFEYLQMKIQSFLFSLRLLLTLLLPALLATQAIQVSITLTHFDGKVVLNLTKLTKIWNFLSYLEWMV